MADKITTNAIYGPEHELGAFSQWNAFIENFENFDVAHAQIPYYVVISGGSIDSGATYTITFADEDGTVLQISTLNAGAIPSYTGATPTKAETVGYKYSFAGWQPNITKATKDITYKAYYTQTAKQFDVVVNDTVIGQVAYGETVSVSALTNEVLGADYLDAQKYTVEWTDASGNPVDNNATILMDENGISLYVSSTATPHTITFYDYDGSSLGTITTGYGETVGAIADPERTGYDFKGWNPAVPATMPAKDITVTAQYTAKLYTIIFNNYDGTELSNKQVAYDTMPVAPTATRSADTEYTYTFKGWDKEVTKVTGDTTYTAEFNPVVRMYSVKFVNYDNTVLQSDSLSAHTVPSYTGITPERPEDAQYKYSFNNTWSPAIAEVTGDATYTAQYDTTLQEYTVTFAYNPINPAEEKVTFKYGETASTVGHEVVIANYSNEQYKYTFTGWDKTLAVVTADTTYTAQYDRTVVQYSFQVNGQIPPRMVDYGTVIFLSAEARTINEEYVDATKYTVRITDNNSVDYTTADTITITGATSIKINGTAVEYLAQYVDDDKTTVLASAKTRYDDEITLVAPTGLTREGYTFSGWTGDTMTGTMPNHDITATAVYKINEHTITYYVDGVQDGDVETYKFGDIIAIRADKTKEGYTFSGWDTALPATMPDNDIEVKGTFSINSYNLTFELDGAVYSAMTVEYNSPIEKPVATAETGYKVSDWASDEEYTTMPAHNVTYTAETSKIPVTLHIELSMDTDETTFEYEENKQIAWGEDFNLRDYISGKTSGFDILNPTEIAGYKFVLDTDPIVISSEGIINVPYRTETYEIYGGYEEETVATTIYYNILRNSEYTGSLVTDNVINTSLLTTTADTSSLSTELKDMPLTFTPTAEEEEAWNNSPYEETEPWYTEGHFVLAVFAVPAGFCFSTMKDGAEGINWVGSSFETIKTGYKVDGDDYDLIVYTKNIAKYTITDVTNNFDYKININE